MKLKICKSDVKGSIAAPPSKSYTLRALACAALAKGQSRIIKPLVSDDTLAMWDVLSGIGAGIRGEGDDWWVLGGNFRAPHSDLHCRDSAGTLRFTTALCTLVPGQCHLTAGSSLARRPVGVLVKALNDLGVQCCASGGYPPIMVTGGKLRGDEVSLPGDISSQFVSALLFIAPKAETGLTIKLISPPESKPYLLMTLQCLEKFGIKVQADPDLLAFTALPQSYRPAEYSVEGDWSSASYLLALGAVIGETTVTNLNPNSLQADRVILDLLQQMGAHIDIGGDSIKVKRSELKALQADLSDCIDLLPTLAVLAASADGMSELRGIKRARIKESDRVAAMATGLSDMGIGVKLEDDRISITGGTFNPAVINPMGDHRIAMAFSIAGAIAGDITIKDAECVSKTYPRYWEDFNKLGGKAVTHGK
jgi:3-phosphoshikimate 1-carboxyvinyltransferase